MRSTKTTVQVVMTCNYFFHSTLPPMTVILKTPQSFPPIKTSPPPIFTDNNHTKPSPPPNINNHNTITHTLPQCAPISDEVHENHSASAHDLQLLLPLNAATHDGHP
ncbi:hypothetical protein FRX31_026755 [Thalictrum thalictroides]|uniref:Uncharacterized protein n=1 Tax=Thalictrum thalictroides TaxID=46969 RepID=A0A7J6VEZ5_THATH|nr:hypothetical protein FRX31_026755 [Thalictrum thalictroides]